MQVDSLIDEAVGAAHLFRHQIGKNTSINETLDVYPELSHLGEYRFALDISKRSVIFKVSPVRLLADLSERIPLPARFCSDRKNLRVRAYERF
jgi:hypothetical protein